MKRRNFLSGLLAAPLAFKAKLVKLFAFKPRVYQFTPIQRQIIQLLAEGKWKEAVRIEQSLIRAKLDMRRAYHGL